MTFTSSSRDLHAYTTSRFRLAASRGCRLVCSFVADHRGSVWREEIRGDLVQFEIWPNRIAFFSREVTPYKFSSPEALRSSCFGFSDPVSSRKTSVVGILPLNCHQRVDHGCYIVVAHRCPPYSLVGTMSGSCRCRVMRRDRGQSSLFVPDNLTSSILVKLDAMKVANIALRH